jgi:acetate kinase
MNVLVINAGISSLKFQVIATDFERIRQDNDELLCRGQDLTAKSKRLADTRTVMVGDSSGAGFKACE